LAWILYCKDIRLMTEVKELKTIIVGFGFSCIPLLRELDRTGEAYLIISDDDPVSVWSILEKSGRLDFDLVSSYYTSFYSFDLVKDPKTDFYPIAKDFYAMHLSYYRKYKDKILGAHVSNVENYDGFSIVHTEGGSSYKATNVVFSVGFKREILKPLTNFDYNITNKTIVFDTIGDSTNMMISKLIAGNNKIICISNGFVCLDKVFLCGNQTVTLDQFEYHNLGLIRKEVYRDTIWASPYALKLQYLSGWRYKLALIMGKLLFPNVFFYKYPETMPHTQCHPKRFYNSEPFPNGIIAIKHWPIDVFAALFGDKLEESMKQGYLLNDISLWIDLGLVEIWKKKATTVNKQNKTIQFNGNEISYDYFVEGGIETPRHPPVTIHSNHEKANAYEYTPRENYFGAIPKKLSNLFIIGNTRPTTGGLANITEMQCLLVHQMISNDSFKAKIYESINERIAEYNSRYYFNDKISRSDHLTHYGFFTEEIARVLGIDIRFKDCKNYKDFSKWLFFPNDTFKYRQQGEYKVEGCDKLVEFIDKNHDRWLPLKLYAITLRLYHLILLIMVSRLYLNGFISLPAVPILCFLQIRLRHVIISLTLYAQSPVQNSNAYRYFRAWLVTSFAASISFISPALFIHVILIEVGLTYLVRLFKPELAKTGFNDLRVKQAYLPFLKQYLDTYRKLFASKPVTPDAEILAKMRMEEIA